MAWDSNWWTAIPKEAMRGRGGGSTPATSGTIAVHNGAQATAQSCAVLVLPSHGWPGSTGIDAATAGEAQAMAAPDEPSA